MAKTANVARRKKQDHNMEHINFVLPSEMKRQLEQRASEQIVTTSHLLRQLIRSYLKNGASSAALSPSGGAASAARS
jgi:hypothetical protein